MMIKQKQRKTFIQFVIVLFICTVLPLEIHAETRTKASLFNYHVTIDVMNGGSLYFDYGENMQFFLFDSVSAYHSACKIQDATTYTFSKLYSRGIIPVPDSDHYFAGFYDENNKKVTLNPTSIDILRVTVDGIYYYDYFESHNNPKYANYTVNGYKKLVKAYLKTIYGTTRYKVMDAITLYKLPQEDINYTAKFEKKSKPKLSIPTTINKSYGKPNFYLIQKRSTNYIYQFKSSNKKVATIDKQTGLVTITGPGVAKLTCTIDETYKTLPQETITTLTVKPSTIKALKGKQEKRILHTSWQSQANVSGYEIQVSNNKSFQSILAKKNITSGKTKSTKVTLKKDILNNYVRIRAYKKSCGQTIYGPYTVQKITKEK